MIEFHSNPNVKWMQVGGVVGLAGAYLFFFPRLFEWLEISALTLGILPVALTAWYLGRRAAVILSVLIIAIATWFAWGRYPLFLQHWPNVLLILAIGFAAGVLRKTTNERSHVTAELQKRLREEHALTNIVRALEAVMNFRVHEQWF